MNMPVNIHTVFVLVGLCMSTTSGAVGWLHGADEVAKLRLAYESNTPAHRAAYFRGYVAGVADSTQGKAWCAGNASAEEIFTAVSKRIAASPAAEDRGAAALVTTALAASFPCRSG